MPVPDRVRDDGSGIQNYWGCWILAFAALTKVSNSGLFIG